MFEVLVFQLGILLVFAVLLGELTSRLGFSSLVGQILAGVIAGPLLGWVHPNKFMEFFSFLGLMILIFLMGLETKKDDIKKDTYTGIALAFSGSICAFLGGLLVGYIIFADFKIGLAIGLALISTSTAVPIKILMDRGEFQTHTGKIFVIMALADDVIAILSLTLFISFVSAGNISMTFVTTLFLAILGFIFFILTFGDKVINGFINFVQKSHDPQILFTIPLTIAFLVGIWSENIGLAAITGAFIAGMAMSRSYFRESIIAPKMKIFGYGLVIPIFFAYSSIFIDLSAFWTYWYLILIILAVGMITKIFGAGYMSRFFGFDKKSQAIISLGMIPRGEYGIAICQITLTAGIITNQIYTILISFIVLTIILTPLFFQLLNVKGFNWSRPKK